jgi:hypothetical protein
MVLMFVDSCDGVYDTFRTIPTVENPRGGSFCSRPNPYSRIPVNIPSIASADSQLIVMSCR